MKKVFSTLAIIVVLAVGAGVALYYLKPELFQKLTKGMGGSQAAEVKVQDFQLLDHKGVWHALYRQSANKGVVLISTSTGCQVVQQAAPRIKALRDKYGS